MYYSSFDIRRMSYAQWMETIAQELNVAGFKTNGYNASIGKWVKNYSLYKVGSDPKDFILGQIEDVEAIEYLKEIGLINNGRCPLCGKSIEGNPGRFTSGYNVDYNFQICKDCARGGRQTSANPANRGGCMIALLLMPWHLIKDIIITIVGSV